MQGKTEKEKAKEKEKSKAKDKLRDKVPKVLKAGAGGKGKKKVKENFYSLVVEMVKNKI